MTPRNRVLPDLKDSRAHKTKDEKDGQDLMVSRTPTYVRLHGRP